MFLTRAIGYMRGFHRQTVEEKKKDMEEELYPQNTGYRMDSKSRKIAQKLCVPFWFLFFF